MVFFLDQGLGGGAFLNALDVKKEVVAGSLENGNGPDFIKHIDGLFLPGDGEGMFDAERDLSLFLLQIHDFTEFDLSQPFGLVPKIHFLSVESRLRPSEEERVLVGVIGGEVAGDFLSGGRVHRMKIAASAVMRLDPFGNRLLGLDVFKNGFSTEFNADRVVGFREL